MPRNSGNNALAFILVTMALDSIGYGLIVPVLPALLKELAGVEAAEAAPWGGYLAFTYAAMNFLASPTLGGLSDRFGRRPVLLVSMGTLAVDFLIMGLAHSIEVLFIGRLLSGISGATMSTANAYVADITEPRKRAQSFAMVGAAFGVGFVIGPAIGGLLGDLDSRAPFFAAAALAFANLLYGWFVLPESLGKDDRRPFDWRRANPLGAGAHFSKYPALVWLLFAVFLVSFAHFVYPSTWSFHADARYGWGSREIGWSLMVVGLGSALVQAAVIGPVLTRLGPVRTAVFGLLCNAVAFVGFALAREPWMLFAWIPLAALAGVGGPAINAIMSETVAKNAQGELQGAMSSVQALAAMLSPLVMTQVFSHFVRDDAAVRFVGAAFVLAAFLTLVSLVPFSIGIRRSSAIESQER